jgi:hypothetical protein
LSAHTSQESEDTESDHHVRKKATDPRHAPDAKSLAKEQKQKDKKGNSKFVKNSKNASKHAQFTKHSDASGGKKNRAVKLPHHHEAKAGKKKKAAKVHPQSDSKAKGKKKAGAGGGGASQVAGRSTKHKRIAGMKHKTGVVL